MKRTLFESTEYLTRYAEAIIFLLRSISCSSFFPYSSYQLPVNKSHRVTAILTGLCKVLTKPKAELTHPGEEFVRVLNINAETTSFLVMYLYSKCHS